MPKSSKEGRAGMNTRELCHERGGGLASTEECGWPAMSSAMEGSRRKMD